MNNDNKRLWIIIASFNKIFILMQWEISWYHTELLYFYHSLEPSSHQKQCCYQANRTSPNLTCNQTYLISISSTLTSSNSKAQILTYFQEAVYLELIRFSKSNSTRNFVHKLSAPTKLSFITSKASVNEISQSALTMTQLLCLNSAPLLTACNCALFMSLAAPPSRNISEKNLAPHVNFVSGDSSAKHVIMCHDNDLNVFLSEWACNSWCL